MEQKCKKKSMGTTINVVGMDDIERSLLFTVDWKVALSKEIYLYFKAASSGTCLVFDSNHGFSTLPSKATVQESPPSFLQAPTMRA